MKKTDRKWCSKEKTKQSRKNGKLGGRPKNTPRQNKENRVHNLKLLLNKAEEDLQYEIGKEI